MALDYQYTLPDGTVSGQIEDGEYAAMLPALAVLERKTGLTVDRYGNTRLYPDHARILIAELAGNNTPRVRKIRDDCNAAAEHGAVMYFCGD